jgi:hypothetical protein
MPILGQKNMYNIWPQIITRIDDMAARIDDLEHNINDLGSILQNSILAKNFFG